MGAGYLDFAGKGPLHTFAQKLSMHLQCTHTISHNLFFIETATCPGYVALATLQRVVNVDEQVMQRHRNTIIDCLKDADISIRKRALDVTYSLVDEANIKSMTKELLNYLLVAEPDFKEELCSKICMAVEKFSPNRRWQIDTLIKVMCLGGNFVKEQQREKFCRVVAATPELHSYTVIKLYFNMKESLSQEALVHVGVWCLGEFGDHLVSGKAVGPDSQPIHVTPGDVLDLLYDVVRKPPTGEKAPATHCLVTAALIKLVTRCPSEFEKIRKLLRRFDCSLHVDLQHLSPHMFSPKKSQWNMISNDFNMRMLLNRNVKLCNWVESKLDWYVQGHPF